MSSSFLKPLPEAAHQDITVGTESFLTGHGKSTFLKADKVQKMQREGAGALSGGLGK